MPPSSSPKKKKWFFILFICNLYWLDLSIAFQSVFLLLSELVLDCNIVFLDCVFSHKECFQFIDKVSLDDNLFACIFSWEILNVGTAGKLNLQLVSKSVNLFNKFFGFNVRRGERFNADDFGDVFVDDFISYELDAFKGSLSKYAGYYLNLFNPVDLSDML